MAFTQFPSNLYVKEIDTSETTQLGGFKVSSALSLSKAVMTIYKHGTEVGAEQMRIAIYPTPALTGTAIATSDYSDLADIPSFGTHWLGNMTFTFSTRPNLNPNTTYYFAVQTASYTKTNDFYISFVLDWPFPVNTQLTSNLASASIRLLGYH